MANITLIRLVDPESQHVKNAVDEIVFNEQKNGRLSDLTPSTMKVREMVLCYKTTVLTTVHLTYDIRAVTANARRGTVRAVVYC